MSFSVLKRSRVDCWTPQTHTLCVSIISNNRGICIARILFNDFMRK